MGSDRLVTNTRYHVACSVDVPPWSPTSHSEGRRLSLMPTPHL